MSDLNPIFQRHRGPYKLVVMRPMSTKPNFYRNVTLPGTSEPEDVEAEARALLADPRDTIVLVSVWSEREEQFVTTFKKEVAR